MGKEPELGLEVEKCLLDINSLISTHSKGYGLATSRGVGLSFPLELPTVGGSRQGLWRKHQFSMSTLLGVLGGGIRECPLWRFPRPPR